MAMAVVGAGPGASLTISIVAPVEGSWVPENPVLFNGSASSPGERALQVSGASGFANGTHNRTELSPAGTVRPAATNYTTLRYWNDFSYSEGTPIVAKDSSWSESSTWVASTALSARLGGAPSLVAGSPDGIYWGWVLPAPAVRASVSFRYATENASLELRVLPDGQVSNFTSVLLGENWTADQNFSFDLTALLQGKQYFRLWFTAGGYNQAKFVGIDDLEVDVSFYSNASLATWSYSQPFDAYPYPEGWYGDTFDWLGLDTPIAINGTSLRHWSDWGDPAGSSIWTEFKAATGLSAATLSFSYLCQSEGLLQVFGSGGTGWTETLILNASKGVNLTNASLDLSSILSNDGFRVRFWSQGPRMNGACAIDDLSVRLSLDEHPPSYRIGTFTSAPIDQDISVNWTTIEFDVTLPTGAGIWVEARTSSDATNWTSWVRLANGSLLPFAPARYAEFQTRLWGLASPGPAELIQVRFGSFAILAVEASLDNGTVWSRMNFALGANATTVNWSGDLAVAPGPNHALIRVRDSTNQTAVTPLNFSWDAYPPGPPGTPDGGGRYRNSTNLSWTWAPAVDVGLGIVEYRINLGTTPAGSEILANVSVGNATSFSIGNGTNGVSYYVTIRARDGASLWGSWSNSSSAVLVDLLPPTQTFAERPSEWVHNISANWSWNASLDAGAAVDFYEIRVGVLQSGTDLTPVGTSAETYFSFGPLVDGQTYYCSIRARDNAGNAGPWSRLSDVVRVDQIPPTAPGDLAGPSGFVNINWGQWSWSASADAGSGVDRYEVIAGGSPAAQDLMPATNTQSLVQQVNGFPEGVGIFVSVRSWDVAGNPSAWVTQANPVIGDFTPPTSGGISLEPTAWSNGTDLSWGWQIGSDALSGLRGYLVRIGTTAGGANVLPEFFSENASFSISGAQEGAPYFLSFRALDRAGNAGGTVASSGSSIDLHPPTAPGAFSSSPSPTNAARLLWSWAPATDIGSGIRGYEVSVGSSIGAADYLDWSRVEVPEFSYSESLSGMSYFISIRALDRVGWHSSPHSDLDGVAVDRQAPGPALPNPLPAAWNQSSIVVSWKAASDSGGAGVGSYEIEVARGVSTNVTFVVAPTTELTLIGGDGNLVGVRLRSVDRAGNVGEWGPQMWIFIDLTPPPEIQSFSWNFSGSRIILGWREPVDSGSGIASYRVSVGSMPGAIDLFSGTIENESVFSYEAAPGTVYFFSVSAVDKAGNAGAPAGPAEGLQLPIGSPLSVQPFPILEVILAGGAVGAVAIVAVLRLGRRNRRRGD